jgi:hypothetical protein
MQQPHPPHPFHHSWAKNFTLWPCSRARRQHASRKASAENMKQGRRASEFPSQQEKMDPAQAAGLRARVQPEE